MAYSGVGGAPAEIRAPDPQIRRLGTREPCDGAQGHKGTLASAELRFPVDDRQVLPYIPSGTSVGLSGPLRVAPICLAPEAIEKLVNLRR